MLDFVEKFKISSIPIEDLYAEVKEMTSIKFFVDDVNIKQQVIKTFAKTKQNIFLEMFMQKNKQSVDKISYSGEDIVVACGSGELGDYAKYYAACFDLPIICVYTDIFLDYNMSKFALLYDGVSNNFYVTKSPKSFYVLYKESCSEMEAYARAKSLEYFDFKFNEVLLQDNLNDDAKQILKNTILELKLENYNYFAIVKAFLKLGMAMTFFDSTKLFLFGYFDMVNFLSLLRGEDKCKTASAIVAKTYLLSFKYKMHDRGVNLNKIINKISKKLKVPSFCVIKSIKNQKCNENVKVDMFKLYSYKESLQQLLLRNTYLLKNYNIDKWVLDSVNFAAYFSDRLSLLQLLTKAGLINV